jgi:hypothetical protein
MVSPVLWLSVAAWAIAQVLKFLISLVVYRKFDLKYLTTGGGMPSSHSALVCACAISTGASVGFDSPVFAVATVVAFIVMYDAAHVRKETGEQAKILNYMMQNWAEGKPDLFSEDLKELIGHTPFQVAMGALLGVAVGAIGSLLI